MKNTTLRITGSYDVSTITGESVSSFLPHPLPPQDPPLQLDAAITAHLRLAEQALSNLHIASSMIPSLDWFLYAFVRKEAVTSSQIEGTQASLIDLFTMESDAAPTPSDDPDLEEICNYLDALKYARAELQNPRGVPLSMRLLNAAHQRLMHGARGGTKQPGTIRSSQNWIGGTRPGTATFVPPPPHALSPLLSAFEKYIHAEDTLPPLIRIGLLHVQFETIHPYLDGNGRIGRLLITLLLEHWQLLPQPLLYLSLFFKRHRSEYYTRLAAVRTDGDWEGWIRYFLEGVTVIATEATTLARDVFARINTDRRTLLAADATTVMALRLFDVLPSHPIVTMPRVVQLLDTTKPTATKAIQILNALGILTVMAEKGRAHRFGYSTYLELLRTGTDI